MAGMYTHVPEDLVFAILVKLPTKPLLRLRCLSKHWNRTISDHFMMARSRRMILLPFKPLQVLDTAAHSVSDLPLPNFMNPGSETYRHIFVGTYNGIVLIVLKDMILYNPLTRAYKTVPNPPPLESPTSIRYGFCYGSSLDDSKIVRLNHMSSGFDQDSRWCDVFSLKKGSWSTTSRTLVRACYIKDKAGTFLNGFLYWVASKQLNEYFIVALDVKELVFSEIQLPDLGFLGMSGGHLYLFLNTSTKFELWVMNEYDMEKPWSKVFTTNTPTGYSIPLLIMGAGKIVMLRIGSRKPKHIIIYDMRKDSEEMHEVQAVTLGKLWGLQAMEYVESLISPSHICSYLI